MAKENPPKVEPAVSVQSTDTSDKPNPSPTKLPPIVKPSQQNPDKITDSGSGEYSEFRKQKYLKNISDDDFGWIYKAYNMNREEAENAVIKYSENVLRRMISTTKNNEDILWREKQDANNPLIVDFKNDFLMDRTIAKAGGGYIQNQQLLEDIPYGKKGTGASNSCGAISDYNFQVSLGLNPDFKKIYNYHSDNSTLLGGNFGTNPLKLYNAISDNPQVENVVVYDHPNLVGEHEAYIVISGNVTNPGSKWMHYQEAHKNQNGEIEFSNPIEQDEHGNNYTSFEDFNNDLIDNNNLVFLIYGIDKKH